MAKRVILPSQLDRNRDFPESASDLIEKIRASKAPRSVRSQNTTGDDHREQPATFRSNIDPIPNPPSTVSQHREDSPSFRFTPPEDPDGQLPQIDKEGQREQLEEMNIVEVDAYYSDDHYEEYNPIDDNEDDLDPFGYGTSSTNAAYHPMEHSEPFANEEVPEQANIQHSTERCSTLLDFGRKVVDLYDERKPSDVLNRECEMIAPLYLDVQHLIHRYRDSKTNGEAEAWATNVGLATQLNMMCSRFAALESEMDSVRRIAFRHRRGIIGTTFGSIAPADGTFRIPPGIYSGRAVDLCAEYVKLRQLGKYRPGSLFLQAFIRHILTLAIDKKFQKSLTFRTKGRNNNLNNIDPAFVKPIEQFVLLTIVDPNVENVDVKAALYDLLRCELRELRRETPHNRSGCGPHRKGVHLERNPGRTVDVVRRDQERRPTMNTGK